MTNWLTVAKIILSAKEKKRKGEKGEMENKKKEVYQERVTVRLTEEMHKKLYHLSKVLDCSISDILRGAANDKLEEQGEGFKIGSKAQYNYKLED